MENDQGTKLEGITNPRDKIAISQEKTRSWLAKFIPVSVVVFIVGVAILSIVHPRGEEYYVIFGSTVTGLVGILGGIIGFYFGGKN